MTKLDLHWSPFITLLEREVRRFLKVVVQTVLTPMITSSLYLLIFGVSLGQSIQLSSGVPYLAFLIPGLVMLGTLNNAFQNSSSSIVVSKFGGDLEDLRVAPLSNLQIVWALAFGGLIRGYVVGSVTFLAGIAFYWLERGELLAIAHPLILLFFLTAGGLAFAMLGMSVGFWATSMDQMTAVSSFILTPLLYLGGVFFSISNLHPLWHAISQFNPLLYLINGVRYGILGHSDVDVVTAAIVTLVTLAIFHFIAVKSFKHGSFVRW